MVYSSITLLRLHQVPGIGQRTLHRILDWAGDSDQRLETLFELPPKEISRLFRLKPELAVALRNSSIERAEALAQELYHNGFFLITQNDSEYPIQLQRQLGDKAPALLYVRGITDYLGKPGIAFSGSRRSSEQGMNHTATLARQAVEQGLTVISGHALGVDLVAHRTALEERGITILVIPQGALTFRLQPELRTLYESSPRNIVVVSGFPPHMPWSAQNAMIRNQLIFGLARALFIIEAGETGGTFAAGQSALRFGVPTYALDYPDPPPSAAGNGELLKQGVRGISVVPAPELPDLSQDPVRSKSDNPPSQLSLF